jgi:hypothetical protein
LIPAKYPIPGFSWAYTAWLSSHDISNPALGFKEYVISADTKEAVNIANKQNNAVFKAEFFFIDYSKQDFSATSAISKVLKMGSGLYLIPDTA